MKKTHIIHSLFLITSLVACTAITTPQSTLPEPVPSPTPQHGVTTTSPITPSPTLFTATSTLVPLPTPSPITVNAIVWDKDPILPILTYHRFLPDHYPESTAVKTRLQDFQAHLQALYDAGYSLVPIESWLNGDFTTPDGRRPLAITLDDLFFADQIFLNPDGMPSQRSGLGVLWNFYQQHPEFGFHLALFANMGDKFYGNIQTDEWWINGPGWEDALARVIAWCIEHNAIVYNHFYTHPRLDLTDAAGISSEAYLNDKTVRSLLIRAHREDLIPRLGNMFALPYGVWPTSQSSINALLNYQTPEGKPLMAVFEVDYAFRAKFLPPPYTIEFDAYHIPRIVATQEAIELLVAQKEQFPRAKSCELKLSHTVSDQHPSEIMSAIQTNIQTNQCSPGIYSVNGYLFNSQNLPVTQVELKK